MQDENVTCGQTMRLDHAAMQHTMRQSRSSMASWASSRCSQSFPAAAAALSLNHTCAKRVAMMIVVMIRR
eukprot:512640-Karenia_brevis.AAC.1